jgi:hypothetical protein
LAGALTPAVSSAVRLLEDLGWISDKACRDAMALFVAVGCQSGVDLVFWVWDPGEGGGAS